MDFFHVIHTPLIIFMVVVVPVWIIAHYTTRWKQTRSVSETDESMLGDLWESASRMEERIVNLEKILDAEVPRWRAKE